MADGVDWGSVADWLGAIGGVSSAGTAAFFYFLDRRRAALALTAEQRRQATFEEDVTTHIFNLVNSVRRAASDYLSSDMNFGELLDLRAELAAMAATATRTQQLPGLPVSRFMDLCDLLEAITDVRILGKDHEATKTAIQNIDYVTKPLERTLAKDLSL